MVSLPRRTREQIREDSARWVAARRAGQTVTRIAAAAGASPAAVRSGAAVAIVVGTVLSTYVAHVLAHSIGSLLVGEATWTAVREELRDAVPIISSGTTPADTIAATRPRSVA